MAENSKIEWCDHTVNFWWGCTKVSEACDHCYAESISNRFRPGLWGKNAKRWMRTAKAIQEIKKLNKKAEKAGRVDKVFINSMSDFFEDRDDLHDARFYAFCVFADCHNLIFLLLTKRPKFAGEWIKRNIQGLSQVFPNVWIGTTVENQIAANLRIPELIQIPAAKRFLSVEPMLGMIKINRMQPVKTSIGEQIIDPFGGLGCNMEHTDTPLYHHKMIIDWIICGGESGNQARAMDIDWPVILKEQCSRAGVPFFMKQGSAKNWEDFKNFESFPKSLQVREFPA